MLPARQLTLLIPTPHRLPPNRFGEVTVNQPNRDLLLQLPASAVGIRRQLC